MWNESLGKKIAHYLALMDTKPNSRTNPENSIETIFDGGKVTIVPGTIRFEFSDGAKAGYGTNYELETWITFSTGETVSVKIFPQKCNACGNDLWIGETKCRNCITVA